MSVADDDEGRLLTIVNNAREACRRSALSSPHHAGQPSRSESQSRGLGGQQREDAAGRAEEVARGAAEIMSAFDFAIRQFAAEPLYAFVRDVHAVEFDCWSFLRRARRNSPASVTCGVLMSHNIRSSGSPATYASPESDTCVLLEI